MRFVNVVLVAVTALGLAVPCTRAQEQQTLDTLSGRSYTGTINSNDGSTVEITTTDGMTLKLPYEQLTPPSQFIMRYAITKPDGKSQLELANWCMERQMYLDAKGCFHRALAASPEMADEIKKQVVVARKTAADELLARGKKLMAEGKLEQAREALTAIVQELPLEDAAKEAGTLLAKETAERKESVLKRPSKAKAGANSADPGPMREDGQPFSDATRQLFQPVIESYKKMLDATQQGLEKSGTTGTNEYQRALKEGDRIRDLLKNLQPQGATNPEIEEGLQLAASKLEEADVDARVNLAHDYLMRTSYNQASDVTNKGLALYPKNERLLSLRSQVVAAASSNGGGDWVIGGRLR